jgi:hypothetical protein
MKGIGKARKWTMHLQQTKQGSRETGGPQYYFHSLTEAVRMFLRSKGAVRVALITPYGATKSDFFAVGSDHKLDSKWRPIPGLDMIESNRGGPTRASAKPFAVGIACPQATFNALTWTWRSGTTPST